MSLRLISLTLVNRAEIVSGTRLCSTLCIKHGKSSDSLFPTFSQFSCRKSGLTGSCFFLLKMTGAAKVHHFLEPFNISLADATPYNRAVAKFA